MVGRGEVDEDLEGETKEECEKYGKVVKCVIFEVRRPRTIRRDATLNFPGSERGAQGSPCSSDRRGYRRRGREDIPGVREGGVGHQRSVALADNKVLPLPLPKRGPFFPREEVDASSSVSPNCCITALII